MLDDENDYAAAESKSNQWSWNYTIATLYIRSMKYLEVEFITVSSMSSRKEGLGHSLEILLVLLGALSKLYGGFFPPRGYPISLDGIFCLKMIW